MQRYFAKSVEGNNILLYSEDVHHIKNVMKFPVNTKIEVVYENIVHNCLIDMINPLKLSIINSTESMAQNTPKIYIAVSLVKEQKMDLILQKCSELGAYGFIPITTKRSIIKYEKNKVDKKIDRWNKILKEASEQSFRDKIPVLHEITSIEELASKDFSLKIICSTDKLSKSIKKVLQNTLKCDNIILVVGPEGGFTNDEEEYLEKYGYIKTSLGELILRVETVPIYALSVINYVMME